MKFIMNGGMIIGTMDGANVEIAEEVGVENMFIFGAKIEEVDKLKEKMHNTPPEQYICPELKAVFKAIEEGRFGSKEVLLELIDTIRNNNDQYLVCEDFPSYIAAQRRVNLIFNLDRRNLQKPGRMDQKVHLQRHPLRQVQQRPNHPRVRSGNLER